MWDLNSLAGVWTYDETWAHMVLLWSWQLLASFGPWEILVTEHPGSQESEMTTVDSFPGHLLGHIWTIFHIQINPSLEILGHLYGSKCYKGNDVIILLESDLLGPGRGCVYFGKGQTFTHLNSFASKISVRGWHKLSIFLTLCLAKQIVNAPRAITQLLYLTRRPPQEVQRTSQKPLGLRDCSRSFYLWLVWPRKVI